MAVVKDPERPRHPLAGAERPILLPAQHCPLRVRNVFAELPSLGPDPEMPSGVLPAPPIPLRQHPLDQRHPLLGFLLASERLLALDPGIVGRADSRCVKLLPQIPRPLPVPVPPTPARPVRVRLISDLRILARVV